MRFVGLEHVSRIPKVEVERAKKAAAAAAEASGARGPLVYVGAGISSLVFCDERERAYKAARYDDYMMRDLFEEEAAWLKAAAGTSLRSSVAKLYKFHPDLLVIERECVPGAERGWQDEDKARAVHDKLTAAMKPKGWGPPEFKRDSYVMHQTRGPVLVDAGFAARYGENFLRRVKEHLRELKRLRNMTGDDAAWRVLLGERFLQDSAWALRMEVLEGRLTASQADPVLEQLYALGAPRENPSGPPPGVPRPRGGCSAEQHAALKAGAAWARLPKKREQRFEDGTVLELRDCPACGSTLVKPIAGPEFEENPPRKKSWLEQATLEHERLLAELERQNEFGVFVWRADGHYPRADAVAVYKRESDAAKKADKLNDTDPRYVVRTLRPERAKPNPPRALSPKARLEAAAKRHGATVDWQKGGLTVTADIDAPDGKVWRASGCSVISCDDYAHDRKEWVEEMVDDLIAQMDQGLDDDEPEENPADDEDDVEYLYHVTYSGLLPGIAAYGLRPNVGRGLGTNAYEGHSKGRIFYTVGDGVDYWHSKLEDHGNYHVEGSSDEFKEVVPVVLRIDDSDGETGELEEDPAGTRDARAQAFMGKRKVPPGAIEFWDGAAWQPITDHDLLDPEAALEWVADSEENDENYEGYWQYKTYSPFMPPDEELT